MFFPFEDYIRVNVPEIDSNNAILYTTTFDCMVFFVARGSNMESDAPVGIYIDELYRDADNDPVSPYIFYAHDSPPLISTGSNRVTSIGFNNNRTSGPSTYLNIPTMVPSGKNLRAFIADSSDRIGGTFHIYRLPLGVLI